MYLAKPIQQPPFFRIYQKYQGGQPPPSKSPEALGGEITYRRQGLIRPPYRVANSYAQTGDQECDIKDDQAIDRGLCLLCNNRELKPQTFVLVFAPEVKVSTTQRASSCTTSAPRVKHVKDSDLFLPLWRILSFVGDKGLKQDDPEASRWL